MLDMVMIGRSLCEGEGGSGGDMISSKSGMVR
jgi:hypothetical protein